MKKTNILIAMFVVIAAASAAKAEMAIDFDGKFNPQSMHDIFADSHQIIPSGVLNQVPVPAPANSDATPMTLETWNINPQGSCMMVCLPGMDGYPNCYNPHDSMSDWLLYIAGEASLIKAATNNVTARKSLQPAKSYEQAAARELVAYYLAQEKIKAVVSAYYITKGNNEAVASLADKGVRVAADNGIVFINRSGSQEQIADYRLAAKIEAIVHPNGKEKILPFIAGATFVGTCMSTDSCWNAVGDGVSSASEAASQIYYSWINPGPAPEMTW